MLFFSSCFCLDSSFFFFGVGVGVGCLFCFLLDFLWCSCCFVPFFLLRICIGYCKMSMIHNIFLSLTNTQTLCSIMAVMATFFCPKRLPLSQKLKYCCIAE